jgi:hypothetical protein
MSLSVTFRKNNQNDRSKKTTYKVYSKCGEEAFDAFTSMKEYLAQLTRVLPVVNVETCKNTDDFLFPMITGSIIRQKNTSYNHILSVIKKLSEKLNLTRGRNGEFTTHSFRRGGAQYRFMHSTPKWSLGAIKWWGGWAKGEDPGTLMKYLVDEYACLENSFSDMMAPRPSDRSFRADETDEWRTKLDELTAVIHGVKEVAPQSDGKYIFHYI